MAKTKIVYLEYIEEFKSFAISKKEIEELKEAGIVADIRLPRIVTGIQRKEAPTLGFLLGQDTAKNGTEYYSISLNYTQAMLNTGARIRFLDYEFPYEQMKTCDGAVLPGGIFDNPADFFMMSKGSIGSRVGKRFFAYKSVIEAAHKKKKPMLGICAGAQMIGSILGKMKMYTFLKNEIPHPNKHKPTETGEVCMHDLKLIKGSPIYGIMDIPLTEDRIAINSRHNQAMVHSVVQDYIKDKPTVKMDIYAISDADGIPEIWGNGEAGILCVQGHPEDLAVSGDRHMQNLYNFVARRALEYKQKNKLNLIKVKNKEK